jgi:hypothetical protein
MNSLLPVYRPARVVLQFGYGQKGLCVLWVESRDETGIP